MSHSSRHTTYRVYRRVGADPARCVAEVSVKDCLRLRRGRGFKMHYILRQCSRRPQEGSEWCWQHAPEIIEQWREPQEETT